MLLHLCQVGLRQRILRRDRVFVSGCWFGRFFDMPMRSSPPAVTKAIRRGLLALLVSVPATAQVGKVFPWPAQYQRYQCKGPFVLEENGNADFLISVETVAGDKPLEMAAAFITPPAKFTSVDGMAFDDAGTLLAAKQTCTVSFSRPAGETRRGAVHIKTSGQWPVIVKDGARSWIAAPGCLTYRDRILVDDGRVHVLKGVAFAYRSGPFGVRELSYRDSTSWVSVAGWRKHWIASPAVLDRSKLRNSEYGPNARAAVLDVVISKEGDIASVKCRSQFPEKDRLVRAATSLRLRPFEADGGAIEVLAHIPVLLGESGNIFVLY